MRPENGAHEAQVRIFYCLNQGGGTDKSMKHFHIWHCLEIIEPTSSRHAQVKQPSKSWDMVGFPTEKLRVGWAKQPFIYTPPNAPFLSSEQMHLLVYTLGSILERVITTPCQYFGGLTGRDWRSLQSCIITA